MRPIRLVLSGILEYFPEEKLKVKVQSLPTRFNDILYDKSNVYSSHRGEKKPTKTHVR